MVDVLLHQQINPARQILLNKQQYFLMVTFPPKILANFSSQPQSTSEKDDLIRIRFHKKATSKEDNLKGKQPYIRQIYRKTT